MEPLITTEAQHPMPDPAPAHQTAELRAEERSEDDGMPEHADKASDPALWATVAAGRLRP